MLVELLKTFLGVFLSLFILGFSVFAWVFIAFAIDEMKRKFKK
jgi:hypothetical protein